MTANPITFTDEQGVEWTLLKRSWPPDNAGSARTREATPDDMARAGYSPHTFEIERELDALRALAAHVRAGRCLHSSPTPGPTCETCALLKAIDEARK